MAKLYVVDSEDGTRVPFLRGILTRSLQKVGLQFEEGYDFATTLRNELRDVEEITTYELAQQVKIFLEQNFGAAVLARYTREGASNDSLHISYGKDQIVPFSRLQYQRCLESIGLEREDAGRTAAKMHRHLLEKGCAVVNSSHLGMLTYRCLHSDPAFGEDVAKRYLSWVHFQRSGRPLIVLIGGTAGSGKSTVATSLASQLDIVRTQSTDMLREVMRMMIPERLLPILHVSSFNAWKARPAGDKSGEEDIETLLADGFRTQSELLSVPCEAVVQRALRERVSLILEGVHVQPSLLDKLQKDDDSSVVMVMLGVLKRGQLRKRIAGRSSKVPHRRSSRYLENFDAIWSLQSLVLDEADRAGVPIIINDNKDEAAREVLRTIIEKLSGEFDVSADEVFESEEPMCIPDLPVEMRTVSG